MSRKFTLPFERGQFILNPDVLSHFYKYSQNNSKKLEAGGQLFSKNPNDSQMVICLATGPHRSDERGRHRFNLDVNKANYDREKLFRKGFHAVGLWHTHPEKYPNPSNEDRNVTAEYLKAFEGSMKGFLNLIVGNQGAHSNIAAWAAWNDDSSKWFQLNELHD